MKMRTLLIGLLLTAGATSAFAQDCNRQSSIARAAANAGNFPDAYEPNMAVLKECPTLRYYHYTDGIKILEYFLQDKNSADYTKYFNELMDLRDQQMKYAPEFATRNRGIPSPARLLAEKAADYLQYAPNADLKVAYGWLKESVNTEKENSRGSALLNFLETSQKLVKEDNSFTDQFFQDYLDASNYVDAAIAAADDNQKKNLEVYKENLVACFINSGVADCESLQSIYGPKVEENKSDSDFLKKTIMILNMQGCRESEAYLQASFYMYQIKPTADAAVGVAYMYFKRGDYQGAVKYFDEALQLETNNDKKAEMAYATAAALMQTKQYSQVRKYCQEAISYRDDFGAPYILIAQAYAASPNWSDDGAKNRLTYSLCIDKLQRAKAVDPSCADDAQKLINSYSAYLPQSADLFMQGIKAGDRITIGGWIGESTTVRTK